MKKTAARKLQFSKIAIARIDKLTQEKIQGGFTDPISDFYTVECPVIPPVYQMSEAPDENGICYAIQ